ncbi:MAG: hypothetical protein GC137_05860 [Alphaproteobacteria bacterium]|nr:hypothetical protein [Alphaproteobacteria bacterium]
MDWKKLLRFGFRKSSSKPEADESTVTQTDFPEGWDQGICLFYRIDISQGVSASNLEVLFTKDGVLLENSHNLSNPNYRIVNDVANEIVRNINASKHLIGIQPEKYGFRLCDNVVQTSPEQDYLDSPVFERRVEAALTHIADQNGYQTHKVHGRFKIMNLYKYLKNQQNPEEPNAEPI